MKQMTEYQKTELNKYGPRFFTTDYEQVDNKPRPRLINPETKTWYIWDYNKREYVNTNKSILENE